MPAVYAGTCVYFAVLTAAIVYECHQFRRKGWLLMLTYVMVELVNHITCAGFFAGICVSKKSVGRAGVKRLSTVWGGSKIVR